MKRRFRDSKGFTLVEIIVTMSIIVLLAAIAAPSMLGFLDSGKQTNRLNIARTLFVAAQSRLSEMKVNKTLKDNLTGKYYQKTDKGIYTDEILKTVLEKENILFHLKDKANCPPEDVAVGNEEYIVSISKAREDDSDDNPVNKLLKPVVIDKEVLDQAIVIEYNIRTGVVSSVFYSDVVDALVYNEDPNNNDNTNIFGIRPYTSFSERKQGYYGVGYTGEPEPVAIPKIVDIYDGTVQPLNIDGKDYENVLYCEAYIPKGLASADFSLVKASDNTPVINISGVDLSGLSTDFLLAYANANTNTNADKHIIYREDVPKSTIIQYGIDISSSYQKYTWVVDFIKGDVLNSAPFNINEKYPINVTAPLDVRAAVTPNGGQQTTSLTVANTHFSGIINTDTYTLKSARHLYNIRHFGDKGFNFRQIGHIDMKDITNFRPIDTFKGNYLGLEKGDQPFVIKNLTIDTSKSAKFENIGLFGEIKDSSTIIRGTALENATITGKGMSDTSKTLNVGSIAGKLTGGLITQSYAFANVTANGGLVKATNAGGLIGYMGSGLLNQSYFGGYYDATQRAGNNPETGSVTADKGNIGGLVGFNEGTIENAYNNARVNVDSVTVDKSGPDEWLSKDPVFSELAPGNQANLGGIVGNNSGTIKSTYFTNFVGIYDTNANSGGIMGTGNAPQKSHYISNVIPDDTNSAVPKADLDNMDAELSGIFLNAKKDDYAQGEDTASYYPYPILKTLAQKTPWEDIMESGNNAEGKFVYYELYTDGTWGFSSNGSLADDKSEKLVANDGYCIEFSYGNEFELYLGNKLYKFRDRDNSNNNPNWEWVDPNNKLTKSPVAYKVEIEGVEETRYRLFIDNSVGEGLMPDSVEAAKPIGVQMYSNGKQILSDAGDSSVVRMFYNPLFANAVYSSGSARTNFIVRSPRHLDNVDRVAESNTVYTQQLNLDFAVYRREINVDATGDEIKISLDESAKMPTADAVVNTDFLGKYRGQNKYIRNVLVNRNNAAGLVASNMGIGLFAQVSGTVSQIALIDSQFVSNKNAGGITAELSEGGVIEQCQVSHVEVVGTNSADQVLGGIVGVNYGTVTDVYYNHSFKSGDGLFNPPGIFPPVGTFASPVYPKENPGNKIIGGIIGDQQGTFTNAYTTAMGFQDKPTIGSGTEGTNIYFLQTGIYNENADSLQGKGITYGDRAGWDFSKMFPGSTNWATADESTTKFTKMLAGKAYPYPRLKDMNHYMDWPILEILLKYYEVYDDDSVGYFFYMDDRQPINTLSYDPDRTVVEEGYLLDLISLNNYDIRFNGNTTNHISDRAGQLFDGRRVIKFTDAEAAGIISGSNQTAAGLAPSKIEAASVGATFNNELKGLGDNGSVYFNPMFAKEIYLLSETDNVPSTKILEVRSPRHMLNINGDTVGSLPEKETVVEDINITLSSADVTPGTYVEGNTTTIVTFDSRTATTTEINGNLKTITTVKLNILYSYSENRYYSNKRTTTREVVFVNPDLAKGLDIKDYTFNQTISLNFATQEINGRKNYKIDGAALKPIGRNVVTNFAGSYDGRVQGMLDEETKRPAAYRIYDLVMNITADISLNDRTGSAFGNLQTGASISNLEFIDPQIRYEVNGMGGGIVSNINFGIIDNVKVQSINRINLFGDINGNIDDIFCGSRQQNHYFDYSATLGIKYAHAHGGIAAATYGPESKIINCIVGTNSHNIEDIVRNNTKITCYSSAVGNYVGNTDYTYHVGGIVGLMANSSQVISSVNMADIQPNLSQMDTWWASTTNTGGIVGSVFSNASDEADHSGQIVGCYNAGTVRAFFGWLGGITGSSGGTKTKPVKIISCYNTGRINIEENVPGILTQLTPKSGVSIRIGGICGETGNSQFINCYNIGYVSGKLPDEPVTDDSKASGSIFGLASYDTFIENCFSLQADQYKPDTIVGKNLYQIKEENNRLAKINGIDTVKDFQDLFSTFWETRENLRNNKIITSPVYQGESYPGLADLPDKAGQNKDYAVFRPADGFYIYPGLSSFTHENNAYVNPHITPWEYIDAVYDTTLKYYEKYSDNTFGFYHLDLKGKPISSLQDKQVIEDGYYLEIGKTDKYDVVINGKIITVDAVDNVLGTGRIGIEFNDAMKKELNIGYNKIRLFTRLSRVQNSAQAVEDDKHNRIIGTNSTINSDTIGKDLYFDYNFPCEIKYGDASTKPEISDKLTLRSLRHLSNISKLITKTANLTQGRTFEQVINIDAKQYNDAFIADYDSAKVFSGAVVQGDFTGVYEGNYKVISNLKIKGNDKTGKIGLFASNKGTIQKLTVHSPEYSGEYNDVGTLYMGSVAAENAGTIRLTSVTGFNLQGSDANVTQSIGSVAGENTKDGIITDVYAVYKQLDNSYPEIPIRSAGFGDLALGGLVGENAGKIEYSLYLAKAPVVSGFVYPITGKSTAVLDNTVLYLGGQGFNDTVKPGSPGIPKSTQQFKAMNLGDWVNWGPAGTYPYPGIRNMTPPVDYPVADSIQFTLAYFEKYSDGEAGFYYYNNDPVPVIRDELKAGKTVTGQGYCIIAPADYTGTTDPLAGKKVILLNATGAEIVKASVENFEPANGYSYYNPAFEKAIFNTQTPRTPVYTIRTPQQMQNISLMKNTAGVTFKPENDLDFGGITLTDSVVTGEFKGTFGNADKTIRISNLTIEAPTVDNIGLFSHNNGTIQNMVLEPVTSIKGNDNVGGIAGINVGLIQNCTVTGHNDGKGMHIQGNVNVGGIAGYNNGRLVSNSVENTTETVKGNNFVGGVVGLNDTVGTVTAAVVNNIKVEAIFNKFGKLVGENRNTAVNSVTGTIDGTGSNIVALGEAIAEAKQAHADASEGYEKGNYLPGSKAELAMELTRADNIYSNALSSEQEIIQATTTLKYALDKFFSKKIFAINTVITDTDGAVVTNANVNIRVENPVTDTSGTVYTDRATKTKKVTVNVDTDPGLGIAEIYARDTLNKDVTLTTVSQGITYSFAMPFDDVELTVVVMAVPSSRYSNIIGDYSPDINIPEDDLTQTGLPAEDFDPGIEAYSISEEAASIINETRPDMEQSSTDPGSEQEQPGAGEVNPAFAIGAGLPLLFLGRNAKSKARKRGDRLDK